MTQNEFVKKVRADLSKNEVSGFRDEHGVDEL